VKTRSLLPAIFVSLLVLVGACGGAAANTADGTTPTATSQPDAAKAYPIRLHRSGHVGDRVQVVFDALDDNTSIMHLASTGNEINNEHKTKRSHLEGVITTVALDARQDELRATLDVKTLTVDNVVLLQDKRIDITKARKADDAILLVDGAPVSADLRKTLKDILELRVGGLTDDDIFGTTQPQLVGGHWPLNGERARADLAEQQGADLSSTTISGETTFVGLKHVGNVDALEMKAEMHLDGIKFPLPQPGATSEPGQATAIMTKLVPVDERRGVLESQMAFDLTVRIHVPTKTGDMVIGDITVATRRDARTTPL
jgi:hypothetical protein